MYACQDYDFDYQNHLQSFPARFGIKAALQLSVVSHLVTVGLLALLGASLSLSWPYWAALGVTVILLALEHTLVHPDDLTHINIAFFNINSIISICLFLGILATIL